MRLIAPVGGQEQLYAAVRCGADGVYLGAKAFNARGSAENFDDASLNDAAAYCHERGVLVYVTLNTLIMDDETEALTKTAEKIAASGADAVIIQDLAVAKLVRDRWPDLPMHASTQMSIHNAAGVRELESLGFAQVVLARELSIDEIRTIHAHSALSLECFVHGAHCMCLSGACYLSSMIGGRSGNRGQCAQPCRTNMKLNGREYALSLKDMCLISHLSELKAAGVSTLKIEGRMKRPEYVAAAVTAYKAALRGEEPDLSTLQAVFSRSGFTDGYLTGKRTIAMFGNRTKQDVTAAAPVLKPLEQLYLKETPLIPVDMNSTVLPNAPVTLTVSDGKHTITVSGEIPGAAQNQPLTADSLRENFAQTGGTPYFLRLFQAEIAPGLYLPLSAQKSLRREALRQLSELRRVPLIHPSTGKNLPAVEAHQTKLRRPALRLRFETMNQLFDDPQADKIILPIGQIEEFPELISRIGDKLIGELPALCFPTDEERLQERIRSLKRLGLCHVLAGNLGTLRIARDAGMIVHGDYGLNILNTTSLCEIAALGCTDATLSFELSMERISRMGGTLPRGLIAGGYLPLMKMRACPAKGQTGCGTCTGINTITDAKSEQFFLLCHDRKYNELLNGIPLYLGDKEIQGVDFITLRFTIESQKDARHMVSCFKTGEVLHGRRTAGLYFRELI